MRTLALVHDGPADGDGTGCVGVSLRRAGADLSVVSPGDHRPHPAQVDLAVVFGADDSAADESQAWIGDELTWLRSCVEVGTPVLGICFGGQLLSRALGGTVTRSPTPEFGWHAVDTDEPDLVPVGPWMEFHFDRFTVPPGAVEVARTGAASQAFVAGPHLGLQFHPEVTPESFEGWVADWKRTGFIEQLPGLGLDVDGLRAGIERHAAQASVDADRLVTAWLARTAAFG